MVGEKSERGGVEYRGDEGGERTVREKRKRRGGNGEK